MGGRRAGEEGLSETIVALASSKLTTSSASPKNLVLFSSKLNKESMRLQLNCTELTYDMKNFVRIPMVSLIDKRQRDEQNVCTQIFGLRRLG